MSSRQVTRSPKTWDEARRQAAENRERITEAEDTAITKGADADPDNPPLDEATLARFVPARPRGRPKAERSKVPVKIRLDPDVVDRLKADGPGWQTRANAALRKAVGLD